MKSFAFRNTEGDQCVHVGPTTVKPKFRAPVQENFFDPGTLVIAGATAGSGYQDWSILYMDNLGFNRFFEGEPHIDQQRLVKDGVLSVFIQQGSNNIGVTTSDLHVLDFDIVFDFLLGDINQDGAVNLLDVDPFVDLLTSSMFQIEADINDDGVVNLLDVGPFVDLLADG